MQKVCESFETVQFEFAFASEELRKVYSVDAGCASNISNRVAGILQHLPKLIGDRAHSGILHLSIRCSIIDPVQGLMALHAAPPHNLGWTGRKLRERQYDPEAE